ncbi:MAG: hypothetical protein ACO37F_13330, partial [Pirellulales bacterium]
RLSGAFGIGLLVGCLEANGKRLCEELSKAGCLLTNIITVLAAIGQDIQVFAGTQADFAA